MVATPTRSTSTGHTNPASASNLEFKNSQVVNC
jgi:hypothetical protein